MVATYPGALKRATNVLLAESLLAEARDLGINVSRAAEAGLAKAVADKRAELWLNENAQAIESSNAYVEQHGLPLAEYRMFRWSDTVADPTDPVQSAPSAHDGTQTHYSRRSPDSHE